MEDDTDPPPDAERPTVLVVEDELEVAKLYELWLETEYTVRVAHDGEEGLEKLDPAVDVVLLDRRMPGMSGDAVLETIRSENRPYPVVIVSAVTPDLDVIDLDFDAYLTKPVDREEVIETVEQMLRWGDADPKVQRYRRFEETRRALEQSISLAELRENDRFQELTEEMARLGADLDLEEGVAPWPLHTNGNPG